MAAISWRALSLVDKPPAKIVESFEADASVPLGMKADKLAAADEEQPSDKTVVKTTKITPSANTEPDVVAPVELRPTYAKMDAPRHRYHHKRHRRARR